MLRMEGGEVWGKIRVVVDKAVGKDCVALVNMRVRDGRVVGEPVIVKNLATRKGQDEWSRWRAKAETGELE